MAYAGIDRKRFSQLLEWGADDDELRRFFADSRIQLIQKGAKVQNLPHGKPGRVRMLAQGLPSATDRLVQKWFSANLTMLDPEPVDDLVAALRMYEDAGESPPEDEAKRLARSCLVHLFAGDMSSELISFLRPPQVGSVAEPPEEKEETNATNDEVGEVFPVALGHALVALAEGRDPDEFLSSLPSATASFVAGVQAIRVGNDEETRMALEALEQQQDARTLLSDYASRSAAVRTRASGAPRGLQMLQLSRPNETFSFNFDRDEVIAVCTRDYPETAVFVHPFAIRSSDGSWIDLSSNSYREKLFYLSGDLIAFPGGRDAPRQPKRGEIGVWRVAENKGSNTGHRTNFHIASEKTPVYEVRDVPFASTEYDSVRGYIKHQVEVGGPVLARTSLFVLRDQLVVGCPAGKDLAKDEGFEAGLPCWRSLPALRFEGRVLVAGPLPPSEVYECEALGSSLRKLFASASWGADKPTKGLVKKVQELIASGEPRLNAARASRLRDELATIDEHEGAMTVLLDEVMGDARIVSQVDELVKAKVDGLLAEKEQLRKSIEQLEHRQSELLEQQRLAEKEQKAIAPAVAKAIRGAFEKARTDALGTLGQVTVFKTLIDELIERPGAPAVDVRPLATRRPDSESRGALVRSVDGSLPPVPEALRALGVSAKSARAIEIAGNLALDCGLVLVIDGLAGRVAAEAWLGSGSGHRKVLECGFGESDDRAIRDILDEAPEAVAVLDANLSPVDVYARPLIDAVLRRSAGIASGRFSARILMTVSDSMAALPLPSVLESISLKVTLDRVPSFLQEAEVMSRLEDIEMADEPAQWFARMWKPARIRVLTQLRSMAVEDAALAMSALEAALVPPTN